MFANRIALIAVATAALAMPAFAQQLASINDLDADRINATQVMIEFEYTGGACETVGTAVLGEITNGNLAVTFPTTSTAEVCTMQAKEIDVEQSIAADATVTSVTVTLLGTDGSVIATGTDQVDQD